MTQYIDKDKVAAELKRRIDFCDKLADAAAEKNLRNTMEANELLIAQFENLLYFLNTLEVKEVDYERELSKYVGAGIHRFFPNVDDDYCIMDSVIWQDYVIETAKHFYELGLKAKKGE